MTVNSNANALRLADFLAELPESVNVPQDELASLDSVFLLHGLGVKPDRFSMLHVIAEVSGEGGCETVCCVMGWKAWLFGPVAGIRLGYDWCYSSSWARVAGGGDTARAAAHRIYYELGFGRPESWDVDAWMADWAGFVSLYPFETCRERAHECG